MHKLLPIVLMMSLSGCAVGPDYQAPSSPQWQPNDWTLTSGAFVSEQSLSKPWWQQFADPTLDTLVERALTQNLTIQAVQQRVQLAQSYRQAVAATKLPQVGIGGGYTAGMLSEQGPIGGPILNPNVAGVQLPPLASRHFDATYLGASVGWEPDLFGKTQRMIEAADARAEQIEIMAEGTRLMVSSAVVENYLSLRAVQQQQQLLQRQLADLDGVVERLQTLRKSGLSSDIEVRRVVAQRAQVQALSPQLATVVDVHSRRLAILLGQAPSSLMAELNQAQPLPQVTGAIPVGLPSEIVARRPDIRFAEQQMVAANAQLGVAIARQYPSFYLTGAPGVVSSDFGELFSSGSSAWSFGAGINWSLFDGGLRDALQAVAESQVEVAALEYQQTLLTAFAEVETLLNAYGHSQQRLHALTTVHQQVEQGLERTQTLVDAGILSSIELLAARASLHQADAALVQARANHSQLVVALYRALGGSAEPAQADKPSDAAA